MIATRMTNVVTWGHGSIHVSLWLVVVIWSDDGGGDDNRAS